MLPTILALGLPSLECECPKTCELNLHYYLHQFRAATDPQSNEVYLINVTTPSGFGTTYVHDWSMTTGPSPTDTPAGRAQGLHIQASLGNGMWYTSHNIIFQDKFAGSTLQVMGVIDGGELGPNGDEWSIMGGTGKFTRASGTIKVKAITTQQALWTRELNIKLYYMPEKSNAGYHGYNGYDVCN